MQDSFLNIYPKLNPVSSNANLPPQIGLWLAHGDEPLLQQWLIDAMRSNWRRQNLAIKRIDLVSAKTWHDVLGELNSLSLFDDATAVIVTGNHKPDRHVQAALESFGKEANEGITPNSVLWATAKADKRALSSKWIAPFTQFGHVIDCNLYHENQRQQLLGIQAMHFGLTLTDEAWQFLMLQTEHHLLSAYQALWRLSYLFTPEIEARLPDSAHLENDAQRQGKDTHKPATRSDTAQTQLVTIDVAALQNALVSSAQYTVFDLSDAMLAGKSAQVIKIIEQLKATNEPAPLALWAIQKDMRLILQLMSGQDPQSIGIWRSKQSLYQGACQRQSKQTVSDWPDLLYQCDKAVKGVIRQPAWELILQAALRVTGVQLFA